MIKVIEEKPIPVDRIECTNCHSLLEYGNADLVKAYDYNLCSSCYPPLVRYMLRCPVCGIEFYANWINK